MIAEAGHYALVLALALALIQSTVPMAGARWRDAALMNVARSTALAQLLFVAISFTALVYLVKSKGPGGTWGSTSATVLSLKALIRAAGGSQQKGTAVFTIAVNGKEAAKGEITEQNASEQAFVNAARGVLGEPSPFWRLWG